MSKAGTGKFDAGRGVTGHAGSQRSRATKSGRSGRPAGGRIRSANKNLQISGTKKKKKKDEYK